MTATLRALSAAVLRRSNAAADLRTDRPVAGKVTVLAGRGRTGSGGWAVTQTARGLGSHRDRRCFSCQWHGRGDRGGAGDVKCLPRVVLDSDSKTSPPRRAAQPEDRVAGGGATKPGLLPAL